ncbi:hypothetical protein [Metabacillus malikii]|uniref:Uncharacterized protein n=1 Tax=Metabacillus malikii TaxID=1504265 RepID=A0ABT9ZMW5_9BACI|nr:hypothetical protein [Metabacillus malikii]MDQ0232565.1 hypothetical protein [Metabacillus malikii]
MSKEKQDELCNKDIDYLHHMLNEQIARICVKEEVERAQEDEMDGNIE